MLWYCNFSISRKKLHRRDVPNTYFIRLHDPNNIFVRIHAFRHANTRLFDNGKNGKRLTCAFPKHANVTSLSLILHHEPPTPLSFKNPPIVYEREIYISEKHASRVVSDPRLLHIATQEDTRYMESKSFYWWTRDIVYFLFDVYPTALVKPKRSQ